MDALSVIVGTAAGLLLARLLAPLVDPVLMPILHAAMRATPRHRRWRRAMAAVIDDLKARHPEAPGQL